MVPKPVAPGARLDSDVLLGMKIIRLILFSIFTYLLMVPLCAKPDVTSKVPPEKFQGTWTVIKETWQGRSENYDKINEKPVKKGKFKRFYFRKYNDKIHFYESFDQPDDPRWQREVTILELTETKLKFRSISSHKDSFKELSVAEDGTAVLKVFWPKDIATYYLKGKENMVQ